MDRNHFIGNLAVRTVALQELAAALMAGRFTFSANAGQKTRSFRTFNVFIDREYFEFWQYLRAGRSAPGHESCLAAPIGVHTQLPSPTP
jgi:hypothetical protein